MASMADAVSILQFEFPDLPEDIAQRALARSARALACIKTLQTRVNVPLFACVGHYNIEHLLPEGMEVQCVECVVYCGCCIEHIQKCDPCPHGYELLGYHDIAIHPIPDNGDETLELYLTLRPTYKACELPEEYLCRYEEILLDEARGLIAEMPNQSWTNVPYSKLKKQAAMGKRNSESVKLNQSGQAVTNQSMTTGECVV